MKKATLLPALLLCLLASGCAVQSVGVETPDASVRVSVRSYPDLVLVPGSPVYYAPWVDQNYFFYDGMYWVFQGDNWYASYWYSGPWSYVRVDYVPVFILRVPVYYYRRPPVYFRGWRAGEPPRWGEHWGKDWEGRHPDWRRHDGAVPPPAPRPDYQRRYSGSRYPAPAQQQELRKQYYAWQPRDRVELSGSPRPDRTQESRQQPQEASPQRVRQQQWRQEREGRQQERLPQGDLRQEDGASARPDGRPLRADDPRQGERGRERDDAERQRIEQWRQQRDEDRQVQEQWRQRQAPFFPGPGRQRPDLNPPASGQERPDRQDEREARDEQRHRQEQWQERRQPEQAAAPDLRAPQGRQPAPAVVAPTQDRGAPDQDARPARKEAPSRRPPRGQADEEGAQDGGPGR